MSADDTSASAPASDSASPTVIQWVLDTRSLWPEAAKTKDLSRVAARALALLTPEEQANVLRFYFVKDAKMQLGSILLKRHVISKYCPGISWDKATAVRDARTKPVFLMPDGSEPLLFNVSHQAGLVVMLAVHNPPPGLAIGVDVVCQPERRDRDLHTIRTKGWSYYVDTHGEVLSRGEIKRLNTLPFAEVDRMLAYFYTVWCLREAYVKMTGEALLAPWLKDLDMRGFTPPAEQEELYMPEDKLEIFFHGNKVTDVEVKIEPFLDEYMVGTVVRKGDDGRTIDIGPYTNLDIESVLAAAEASRGAGSS